MLLSEGQVEPGHIALLGDSILDNGSYTLGGPDVIRQLRALMPRSWRASLLAVDGSMIADLPDQLAKLPSDASHLVVAIGGNDVLASMELMRSPARSVADALVKLGDRATRFERAYRTMIDRVRRLGLSTTVCTIYNGNLSEDEAAVARVGLTAFNDVILRVAFESRFRVIDLRLVCSEPSDYANPIEPSSAGGEKIARAILASLGLTEPPIERSEVFF